MWVLRIRSPSHPGSARATADNLSESFELLLLYIQVKEERKRGKLSFSYFLSLTGYAEPPNAEAHLPSDASHNVEANF